MNKWAFAALLVVNLALAVAWEQGSLAESWGHHFFAAVGVLLAVGCAWYISK